MRGLVGSSPKNVVTTSAMQSERWLPPCLGTCLVVGRGTKHAVVAGFSGNNHLKLRHSIGNSKIPRFLNFKSDSAILEFWNLGISNGSKRRRGCPFFFNPSWSEEIQKPRFYCLTRPLFCQVASIDFRCHPTFVVGRT